MYPWNDAFPGWKKKYFHKYFPVIVIEWPLGLKNMNQSPVFSIDYFRVVSKLWCKYWSKQTMAIAVRNQCKKTCKLKT